MHDYMAIRINANPCNEDITDLLAAFLADIEFETFEPDEKGLTGYIRKDKYNKELMGETINDFPIPTQLNIEEAEIKGEDWNKEWEQNYFKPIQIADKLLIRSSFHNDFYRSPIEIIIDPKMAFGTGHHATTAGMSKMLLDEPIKDKSVIDMGTGTGILSILSKKLGAGTTVGIDIDKFAVENAIENGRLNDVQVEWIIGDEKVLDILEPSDIFLANINLNVITENIEKYIAKLKKNGKIFLSGFLISDREKIKKTAERIGLELVRETSDNGWMVMVFIKK